MAFPIDRCVTLVEVNQEKAPNYWEYEHRVKQPLSASEMLSTEEGEPADEQEIGWQKKFQFTRALNHARAARATHEEIIYLARHGRIYPSTPWYARPKPIPGTK